MPRRKQPRATNQAAENPAPVAPSATPKWKWKVLSFIFALLILSTLWSSGVFRELTAGPKIPLPRDVVGISLGMSLDELEQKFPKLKKKLRSYNSDNQFKIATLKTEDGLTDATSMDLLFFLPNNKLYFVSTTWDNDAAHKLPYEEWVKQYRRWNKVSNSGGESLGAEVLLKEWHFNDTKTEMVLRDLNYSNHVQRWQDLRDATNEDAQAAFAKYRLDGVN